MARFTINGISYDPLAEPEPSDRKSEVSSSSYLLVQAEGPFSKETRGELDGTGVAIHEYLGGETYLCGFRGNDLDMVRRIPGITWVASFPPGLKIGSSLNRETNEALADPWADAESSDSRDTRLVDVVVHADVDPATSDLIATIAAAARLGPDAIDAGRRKFRLVVQERYIADLAAIEEVRWIDEVPKRILANNVAGPIIGANVVINGTSYQGDGQVIAVADTGFDLGVTNNVHPAFTNRVVNLYDLGKRGKSDDPDGHGTHVAGSALGDGNSPTIGVIQGTAPKARLVLQSILDATGDPVGGLPPDLNDLFGPPYSVDGARVHTNSWATAQVAWGYDPGTWSVDEFAWGHQDMVIVFCAGNAATDANDDGVADGGQIGSTSSAKNCITVGASESNRPAVKFTYDRLQSVHFKVTPIGPDRIADKPDGMAAFSSRGPTRDGRIKPDVVAPGTSILSARSRALAAVDTRFGVSPDDAYRFDSGTSMATPLVAGCAAVLRETLVKNGWADPPSALIKALLINGATELKGQYTPSEAGRSPNNSSGWGRVDLAGSVVVPGTAGDSAGIGTGGPLRQGDEDSFKVHVPGSTFKMTLVWTDPPGGQLQNDLDLVVRAANGVEYHGNKGPTQEDYDRVNNVEQVYWEHVPPGDLQIFIRAFRIPVHPQPYAWVWRLWS